MAKALLNFSGHALSDIAVRRLSSEFEVIETIPVGSIDFRRSVEDQVRSIIEHVKTPLDGSIPITIIVPGQATLAVLLFVFLHGLIGHYPGLCLLETDVGGEYAPTNVFYVDSHELRLGGRTFRQKLLRSGQEFPAAAATTDPSSFFEDVSDLIPDTSFGRREVSIDTIPSEGRLYLRLYPKRALKNFESELAARTAASAGSLRPMGVDLSGWGYSRNQFGAIAYESPHEGKLYNLTELFLTREIWGVDAWAVNKRHCEEFTGKPGGYIPSTYVERLYADTLTNYLRFAQHTLNLPTPLHMESGLVNVKGYPIALEQGMHGQFLQSNVVWQGFITNYSTPVDQLLDPFLSFMWQKCGLSRPDRFRDKLRDYASQLSRQHV